MHENEIWQKYYQNGAPITGKGFSPEEFRNQPNEVMGNAHIWFWKAQPEKEPEILLQKRAYTKVSKPGMYHISAGGHINVGETPLEAAKRETTEEMGIHIAIDKLYYVGSMRLVKINPNSIVNVFLYRLSGNEKFEYLDGEVDSVEWRTLSDFKKMTQDPKAHNLVDQGQEYFNLLMHSLERVVSSTFDLSRSPSK